VANNDKLHYEQDYPLSEKRRDLLKTSKDRPIDEITLQAVMDGEIEADEIRVTPEVLEYQAQIAESIGRPQLASNMRRAAELTRVSDDRLLEIYNALRPSRSTKSELNDIADELENEYDAKISANLIREAADVYETHGRLREPEEDEAEGQQREVGE
jgi:propanediol dehydratase small subunit